MAIFKISIMVGLIALLSVSSKGQDKYSSEVLPVSYLTKYPLSINNRIQYFYSIPGLKEAKMYNMAVGSLDDFEKRKKTYKIILREAVLQTDFDLTNMLPIYNDKEINEEQEESERALDIYKELLKWSEISSVFTKAFYVDKTVMELEKANLTKNARFLKEVKVSQYSNLSNLLSLYSIGANSVSLYNTSSYLAHYRLILTAAQFDIALIRLEELKDHLNIKDQAYQIAINELIDELKNVPSGFWETSLTAIKQNALYGTNGIQDFYEIVSGAVQLKFGFMPVCGWIDAALVVVNTYLMIRDWEQNWREVTLLGTVYHHLSVDQLGEDAPEYSLNMIDVIDCIQFLFLKKFDFGMNNKYLRFWEILDPEQKEVRLFVNKDKEQTLEKIITKRVNFWLKSNEFAIVPGVSVGKINTNSTIEDVRKLYTEQSKLVHEEGYLYPDMILPVYNNKIAIQWQDKHPDYVVITQQAQEYSTAEGVKTGLSIEELERINGKSFELWRISKTQYMVTNWSNGNLSDYRYKCQLIFETNLNSDDYGDDVIMSNENKYNDLKLVQLWVDIINSTDVQTILPKEIQDYFKSIDLYCYWFFNPDYILLDINNDGYKEHIIWTVGCPLTRGRGTVYIFDGKNPENLIIDYFGYEVSGPPSVKILPFNNTESLYQFKIGEGDNSKIFSFTYSNGVYSITY